MIHFKLTIMALLWAGGFVAGKIIVDYAGPFTVAFFRFFIATGILVVILMRDKPVCTKINLKLFTMVAAAAFTGEVLYNYLFFSGIKLTDAGQSSVILSITPIAMMIASYVLFGEKLKLAGLLGVAISIIGAWVVISQGNLGSVLSQIGLGEIYILLCVICVIAFAFLSKEVLNHLSPLVTLVYLSALGTMFLMGPAFFEMQQTPVEVSTQFVVSLLYMAIGPSVFAVMYYYEGIAQIGPSKASQYMNLVPVFSVLLAFLILGEELSASLILGGGMVTTGLYLAK